MKFGSILLGIFGIFLLLGPFRQPISDGVHGWVTDEKVQTESVSSGGTSANVTLDFAVYGATTTEITVTSSAPEDAPSADTYYESTQGLYITGLDSAVARTLTIDYYAEPSDTVMAVLGPFVSFLLFGACLFAIAWGLFKK